MPDPFGVSLEELICPAIGLTWDTGENLDIHKYGMYLFKGLFDPSVKASAFDSWETLLCLLYMK